MYSFVVCRKLLIGSAVVLGFWKVGAEVKNSEPYLRCVSADLQIVI